VNFEISRSKQLSLRSEGHRLPRRRRVAIYTLHEGCASESSTISLFRTDRKISIVAAHLSDEEARAKPILHILITPRAVSCQRRVAIVLQLTALLQLLSVANAQSRHCTAMFCRVLLNAHSGAFPIWYSGSHPDFLDYLPAGFTNSDHPPKDFVHSLPSRNNCLRWTLQ